MMITFGRVEINYNKIKQILRLQNFFQKVTDYLKIRFLLELNLLNNLITLNN